MNTEVVSNAGGSGVCPKCGTPKAADAAEGLCPKCLMSVGLGTQPDAGGEGKAPPPSPESLAAQFPQLEILEVIGQGGMGVVYRAKQRKLDRVVALKILTPGAAKDPAFAERFHREARALARLNHPNILTVYDFGEADGLFYLVMEYVDGADLRQVLQQGRLSPAEALRIVPVVCDALQYAHASGVVHRDIKPGNILLDREGRVKIADFGIAKLAGTSTAEVTLTQSQQSMGTPHYMAPEQVESPQTVDHRADIYSLGVVFYEMLTGELPLGRFAPPSRRVQVDVRVDEVVLRALEKEPARRYQQAGDVKTEVERIQNAPVASVATPVIAAGGVSKSGVNWPWFWMTSGIAWALWFGAAFIGIRESSRSADRVSVLFVALVGFGTLAPLGTSLCGWGALWVADRRRCATSVLRGALAVLWMLPTLGLAMLGTALGMSVWIEVFGLQASERILLGCVLATVSLIGWGIYRVGGWWLRLLRIEHGQRPPWVGFMPAVPVFLGLLATLFTVWVFRNDWERQQFLRAQTLSRTLADGIAAPVGVPIPSGSEGVPVVGGPTVNIPMLGQAPEPRATTPVPVFLPNGGLQADQPATWEMTAQGPVFTATVAQRVLRRDAPAKLAALNVALQKAWGEYREVLAANVRRSTNAAGHTVLRLHPIVPELERISDRFWTAADAVLEPIQQDLLRQIFLPQWRPRWTGPAQVGGVYDATRALLRFGELPYYFEFWKEGAWYRVRESEGDFSEQSLERTLDFRVQYLSDAQRLLVEAGEGAAAVTR